MEPMKKSSNVTRLPGAEDIRLREPPHNFEAEQALLGAILINNAAYQRVAEFLRPEHFADPLHGKLFDSLSRLIERGQVVSAVTLKTYVEQDEDMKAAGGATYLARLAAASVHVIDATAFGQAVHDLYLRRQLIDLGEGVVNGAFGGDVDETALNQIEVAEKKLYDLASSGQTEGGFKPFRVALTEATVAAEAAYRRVGQLTGVASGLFQLDQLLGGLHRSDLIILAGRPSMGKTALATNIAFNASRAYREEIVDGKPKAVDGAVVGFFSLEMSSEQLATRMLAEQAEVPSEKIRKGELITSDFDRVLSVSHELEHLNFFIDDTPALSIAALRTRARRLKRTHGLGLLVVDYLQLLVALGQEPPGQPRAGGLGDHPRPQDPRQGARRAGACPVAAQPRRRAARGQAAAALRPARIGLDRAGRRCRHVRLSRGVLPHPLRAERAAPRRATSASTSATRAGASAASRPTARPR